MNRALLFLMTASLFGLLVFLVLFAPQKTKPLISSPLTFREPLTILAVGDINLGRKSGEEIYKGNINFPFANIADFLQTADITFGNLESQLRDTRIFQDPNNEYRFSGPLLGAQTLKEAGFDALSVANNHMWDYGQDGLNSTLTALQEQGLATVGANQEIDKQLEPQILEKNGWKVAFFALTDFINGYEKVGAADYIAHISELDQLLARIGQVKEGVDLVIVSFHNGVEYSSKPSSRSVGIAHQLIEAGADIIIGHHPHVVQPLEEYVSREENERTSERKGLIFYSLGNFAFWQPFSFWTKAGLAIRLTLSEPHEVHYELVPIDATWQPKVALDLKVKEMIENRVLGESYARS